MIGNTPAHNPYGVAESVIAEINSRFTYHPPKHDQQDRYVLIREEARKLAMLLASNTPPSREQALALTHLDQCVMCANAAIARHEHVT
jgi:hypothetical protein